LESFCIETFLEWEKKSFHFVIDLFNPFKSYSKSYLQERKKQKRAERNTKHGFDMPDCVYDRMGWL
jgi:hypothetical protein